eukprot:1187101-Prorocentrum_minimum.AAC.1
MEARVFNSARDTCLWIEADLCGLRLGRARSTAALTEAECSTLGLVDCHAYAVLSVREVSAIPFHRFYGLDRLDWLQRQHRAVCGRRLLLLKNPWSEVRWKGHFSPEDTARWTPELKAALQYDNKRAKYVLAPYGGHYPGTNKRKM